MKYLAILRDSLREAIDTKVLYVMVGLSVLLVLFILSCRFDPLPAKRFFDSTVSGSLSGGLGDPDGRAKRGGKKFGGGGPQAAPADDPLVNLGFDVIDAKATDGDDDSSPELLKKRSVVMKRVGENVRRGNPWRLIEV